MQKLLNLVPFSSDPGSSTALEYSAHTYYSDAEWSSSDKNFHKQGVSGFSADALLDTQKSVVSASVGVAVGLKVAALTALAFPPAAPVAAPVIGTIAGLGASISVSYGTEKAYEFAGSRDYFKNTFRNIADRFR